MTDVVKELASITPRAREQFHQSFIRMLGVCQLQAMYRYELGIRRPPSAYLHVGTAVDRSVTADLQNKIDLGELLPRTKVIGVAEEVFDSKMQSDPIELDPEEVKEGKSKAQIIGENKDKTLDLAGLHYDKVAPALKPTHVARRFSINMDGWLRKRAKQLHQSGDKELDSDAARILHAEARAMNSAARIGIDLAGEIDVQEGDDALRDTKTSKRRPGETAAEESNQLVTYSLAKLVLDKNLPRSVVLDYLVRTDKRHDLSYVQRETTVDMTDVNTMLFRFARAVHSWHTAKKSGAFLPANPDDWHCSERFCGYWGMCPAAKRPKQIAIPSAGIVQERPEGSGPSVTPLVQIQTEAAK